MTAVAEEQKTAAPALLRYPVTTVLSLAWVLVFVLLGVARDEPIRLSSLLYGGFISPEVSHGFGDVTPIALYGGQFWRAITATFVHFNVLHLALNLIAFVQLGRIVESWYGSWQFLAIYVVLGAGANLGANLLRPWFGGPSSLLIHSGGGSTVVLGLIGLVAVVGWRNPSEFAARARFWLVAILVANGVLGLLVPNIDNFGHAAGAIVGGLLGLTDRRMLRLVDSRVARIAGAIGGAILIGSIAAQVVHRRAEAAASARVERPAAIVRSLTTVDVLYHLLAARGLSPAVAIRPKPPNLLRLPILVVPEDPSVVKSLRASLLASLRQLRERPYGLDEGPTADSYQTVRLLGARSLFKRPTHEERAAFEEAMRAIATPAWRAYAEAGQALVRLQNPPALVFGEALSQRARRPAGPPAGGAVAPPETSRPPRTPASSAPTPETR